MKLISYLTRTILDVRTKAEFKQAHLPGAINIPINQILNRYHELNIQIPYTVVCDHGVRSIMACDFLQSKGYDVINLPGGISRIESEIQLQLPLPLK